MKSLVFSVTLLLFTSFSYAAGADCAAYYTSNPKSLFSPKPEIVRVKGEAKMNSIPGQVSISDENYIVTMSFSRETFTAAVFSVVTHRLLVSGQMKMSEASNFEQALEIVLKRFVYQTPEKSDGKIVYLTYSCIAN